MNSRLIRTMKILILAGLILGLGIGCSLFSNSSSGEIGLIARAEPLETRSRVIISHNE
ncbi:MAG: hypothetical protein K9M84_14140 [Spirochaetia bacterium]|nr:hypothetical protein [Spirochaetia bacterium]